MCVHLLVADTPSSEQAWQRAPAFAGTRVQQLHLSYAFRQSVVTATAQQPIKSILQFLTT